MKKTLILLALLLVFSSTGFAQGSGPIVVREVDGSPRGNDIREFVFPNGSLTVSGKRATIASGGGGGSGDVVGPASATDNAVARFNLTTGKLIQNSVVTIGDTGNTTGIANLTFTGVLTGGSAPTTITDSAGKVLSAALNTVQPAQGGTGVTSLGTGIATFLGTPSSANFLSAVTDETGSGLAVANNTPTIITPSFTTGFTIGGVAATGTIPRGNGTNFVASSFTMAAPGTSGNVLTSDGTNWTSAAPAGGGTPGGSDTQLQFNNAGSFGGISGATTNGTAVTFTSGNLIATSAALTTPAITTSATVARSAIGVTSADGLVLTNATAAAAGAQQYSPRLRLTGQGWKTTATAASQTVDWIIENQPVQGAANPSANLIVASQINGGGYNNTLTVGQGTLGITNGGQGTSTLSVSSGSLAVSAGVAAVGSVSWGNGWGQLSGGGGSTAIITTAGTIDIRINPTSRNLIIGAADAASPGAQTLSVQNVAAGTSNTAGANWTHAGSRGTGTGAGGSIIFQTAPAGTSGSSQNALVTAVTIDSSGALYPKSFTFANLPTIGDGGQVYCSDCAQTTPFVDSTCAGSGTGAMAFRLNGAWKCHN